MVQKREFKVMIYWAVCFPPIYTSVTFMLLWRKRTARVRTVGWLWDHVAIRSICPHGEMVYRGRVVQQRSRVTNYDLMMAAVAQRVGIPSAICTLVSILFNILVLIRHITTVAWNYCGCNPAPLVSQNSVCTRLFEYAQMSWRPPYYIRTFWEVQIF